MALILIDLPPNAAGERLRAEVEEGLLVRTEGVLDDDNEYSTWVEYRFPDSDLIVHRSVHVTLKRWPHGLAGVLGEIR